MKEKGIIRIAKAAEGIGVTTRTLKRWDDDKLLVADRELNIYNGVKDRVYTEEQIRIGKMVKALSNNRLMFDTARAIVRACDKGHIKDKFILDILK